MFSLPANLTGLTYTSTPAHEHTGVNVAMQIPNMGKNAVESAATHTQCWPCTANPNANANVAPRPAPVEAYTGCKQRPAEGPLQLQLPLIYGAQKQERISGSPHGKAVRFLCTSN